MPYITQIAREELRSKAAEEANDARYPENAGELNYYFTVVCKDYIERMGGRYQQINDVIGALEGCKLEFYRRLVAPYEDKKIEENGDVY